MPTLGARELVSDRCADIKEQKFRTLDVYQISVERICHSMNHAKTGFS
jgi:hypothetical protein